MRISTVSQQTSIKMRKSKALRKPGSAQRGWSAEKTDIYSFSSKAEALQSAGAKAQVLAASISEIPEIRAEKIAEVRAKIENGYYNTSEFAENLARELLKEMKIDNP